MAFALVAALAGHPLPPGWLAGAGRVAEGAWLGALSGVGTLLGMALSRRTPWGVSPQASGNRLAASLITLWTAVATFRRLPAANPLEGPAVAEAGWVIGALCAGLLLLLLWRALVYALDRVSAGPPTGESFLLGLLAALLGQGFAPGVWTPGAFALGLVRVAAITGAAALSIWLAARVRRWTARHGRPLRRLRHVAWMLLGAGTLAVLVVRPAQRPDGRSLGPTKAPVFLRSPALGPQALVKLGPEVRAVVAAACPSDRAYPVDGARRVELAWGTAVSSRPGSARFRALVKTPEGRKSVLVDEEVTSSAGEAAKWFSRVIALPAGTEAGEVVLRTRGTSQASFWAAPVFSGRPGPATPRRNMIVVSLDTVRADHLNAYGYKRRRTSPEFDAWAQAGTLFENAVSAAPGTLSSQMSLLTGRYPSSHGVSYANWRLSGSIPVLPAGVPTLAELLGPRGVLTAAFTGSGYFAMPAGYSRGFGEFISTNDESLGSAASVFEKAFDWLERHRDEAFFLFLHTYEAHLPYLDQRFVYAERLGPQDKGARNEALYDGDIRRADTYLGELRRRLEQLGIADSTLLLIVSDHGEEFGDHFDVWSDGHGHSLYQEQIHVPLLVVGPSIPRGRRVEQPVDLTAVAPTLLEFLGVEPPDGMDGRSLLGLLRGQPAPGEDERLAFSEDVWIGPATRAVLDRDWKLIEKGEDLPERFLDSEERYAIHRQAARLARRMLFHLPSDPGEGRNRLAEDTVLAGRLSGRLNARLARPSRAAAPAEIPVEGETLERLRSLGYVR